MRIEISDFETLKNRIYSVRSPVFEIEQGVSRAIERDGFDKDCIHVLAYDDNNEPVGTARLMPDGKIGRMAVIKEWRKKGIGGKMLAALIETASEKKMDQLFLNSQKTAVGFYSKFGFKSQGSEFIEADIIHIKMVKHLKKQVFL